jgi:hypothetical protein
MRRSAIAGHCPALQIQNPCMVSCAELGRPRIQEEGRHRGRGYPVSMGKAVVNGMEGLNSHPSHIFCRWFSTNC